MKINWIFDLDYTLYHLHPQARQFDYNYLQYDPELKKKIQLLPGRKLLFTNANVWHTLKCVKMMRIEKTFHKVCCRELAGLKPDISSYIIFNRICQVQDKDISFFFEDTLENLIQAKNLGWRTVYIGNKPEYLNYARNNSHIINYAFPNISQALHYFNNNIQHLI